MPHTTTPPDPEAREALGDLFSAAYEELRRLAARVSRSEAGQTLNPTALVNEAYLKLAASYAAIPRSRLHFRRLTARAMRQVLVEAARRRNALKRGSGQAFVTLEEGLLAPEATPGELLALDDALERLSKLNERQALMVEYRYFGGLETAEIAELLDISESTVLRDWRAARAWLARELADER